MDNLLNGLNVFLYKIGAILSLRGKSQEKTGSLGKQFCGRKGACRNSISLLEIVFCESKGTICVGNQ